MENSILVLRVDRHNLKHELVSKYDGTVYLSADIVVIDDYPELKLFLDKFKE